MYIYVYTIFICQIAYVAYSMRHALASDAPSHSPTPALSLARFHFGISLLFPYLTRAPSHQIFRRKPSIVACIAFLSKRLHSQAIVRHKVGERERGIRGVGATRLRMPIKNLNQFSIWISHNCICISASVSGASASVAFS